jgi:hypothetical protein
MSPNQRPMRERVYAVFAKHGILQIIECERSQLFALARERGAGICGAFENRRQAENFIAVMDVLPSCMWPEKLT